MAVQRSRRARISVGRWKEWIATAQVLEKCMVGYHQLGRERERRVGDAKRDGCWWCEQEAKHRLEVDEE